MLSDQGLSAALQGHGGCLPFWKGSALPRIFPRLKESREETRKTVDETRAHTSGGWFREQECKPSTDPACLPRRDERATRVHRVLRKGPHTESRCRLAVGTPVLFRGAGPQLLSVQERAVPMSQASSMKVHGPDPCAHMLGGCQAPLGSEYPPWASHPVATSSGRGTGPLVSTSPRLPRPKAEPALPTTSLLPSLC